MIPSSSTFSISDLHFEQACSPNESELKRSLQNVSNSTGMSITDVSSWIESGKYSKGVENLESITTGNTHKTILDLSPANRKILPKIASSMWVGPDKIPTAAVDNVIKFAESNPETEIRIYLDIGDNTNKADIVKKSGFEGVACKNIEFIPLRNFMKEPSTFPNINNAYSRFFQGGKYAVASDFMRNKILHANGGVYFNMPHEIKGKINWELGSAAPDEIITQGPHAVTSSIGKKKKDIIWVVPNSFFAAQPGCKLLVKVASEQLRKYSEITRADRSGYKALGIESINSLEIITHFSGSALLGSVIRENDPEYNKQFEQIIDNVINRKDIDLNRNLGHKFGISQDNPNNEPLFCYFKAGSLSSYRNESIPFTDSDKDNIPEAQHNIIEDSNTDAGHVDEQGNNAIPSGNPQGRLLGGNTEEQAMKSDALMCAVQANTDEKNSTGPDEDEGEGGSSSMLRAGQNVENLPVLASDTSGNYISSSLKIIINNIKRNRFMVRHDFYSQLSFLANDISLFLDRNGSLDAEKLSILTSRVISEQNTKLIIDELHVRFLSSSTISALEKKNAKWMVEIYTALGRITSLHEIASGDLYDNWKILKQARLSPAQVSKIQSDMKINIEVNKTNTIAEIKSKIESERAKVQEKAKTAKLLEVATALSLQQSLKISENRRLRKLQSAEYKEVSWRAERDSRGEENKRQIRFMAAAGVADHARLTIEMDKLAKKRALSDSMVTRASPVPGGSARAMLNSHGINLAIGGRTYNALTAGGVKSVENSRVTFQPKDSRNTLAPGIVTFSNTDKAYYMKAIEDGERVTVKVPADQRIKAAIIIDNVSPKPRIDTQVPSDKLPHIEGIRHIQGQNADTFHPSIAFKGGIGAVVSDSFTVEKKNSSTVYKAYAKKNYITKG